MKASVYRLHVGYEGLEDKIWRDIEVSSNYFLNMLGYAVLATFDTLAYHLFEFHIRGECFQIPHEEFDENEDYDMANYQLYQFEFKVGDTFTMEYDFGTTQTFRFTVTDIQPMGRGASRAYPKIAAGKGWGILDDVSADELAALISQIEKNGKTDEEIYYADRIYPWDFRPYDIKTDNALLKGEIEGIEDGYYPLWETYKNAE